MKAHTSIPAPHLRALAALGLRLQLHRGLDAPRRGDVLDLVAQALEAPAGGGVVDGAHDVHVQLGGGKGGGTQVSFECRPCWPPFSILFFPQFF